MADNVSLKSSNVCASLHDLYKNDLGFDYMRNILGGEAKVR